MTTRHFARVKTWVDGKGFGFLSARDLGEPFVHVSNVRGKELHEGDWVQFSAKPSTKKPGTFEAVAVVPFGSATADELTGIVGDAFSRGSKGVVLFDWGIAALERLPDETQTTLITDLIQATPDNNWAAMHSQLIRYGSRLTRAASVVVHMTQQGPSFLDSELHLEWWKSGEDVPAPSVEKLVEILVQDFQGKDAASPVYGYYTSARIQRLAQMKLIPVSSFKEVLKAVDEVRVNHDVMSWVRELDALVKELGSEDSRSPLCTARLDWICANRLTKARRIELSLVDEVGQLDPLELIECWTDLDGNLKSKFFRKYDSGDTVTLNVFRGLIVREGLTPELTTDWESIIRSSEQLKEEIKSHLGEVSPEVHLELWLKQLFANLTVEAFRSALGDAHSHTLDELERAASRLERIKWASVVQLHLDEMGEVSTARELEYVERIVGLCAQMSSGDEEYITPSHPAVLDKRQLEKWTTTESLDWVGVDLFRRTSKFLDVDLHVAVARKFFWHVAEGHVEARGQEFYDFIEVGCGDCVSFAERLTWKLIRSIARENEWPSFEEILGEYVRNRKGWPRVNGDVWPLLDRCQGRSRLKFPRKLSVNDAEWTEVKAMVDCVQQGEIFIRSRYEDRFKIREIPGTTWLPERSQWRTDMANKEAVLSFAREMGYLVRDEGDYWRNNAHLVTKKIEGNPIKDAGHCIRCEGREAQKQNLGFDFWWCRNGKCYEATHETQSSWRTATLKEFLATLGVDMSSVNHRKEVSKRGKYQKFLGAVNRFLSIYKHLECGWKSQNHCQDRIWLVPLYQSENGQIFHAFHPLSLNELKLVFVEKDSIAELGLDATLSRTWEREKELGETYQQFQEEAVIKLDGFEIKPYRDKVMGVSWLNRNDNPWYGLVKRDSSSGCGDLLQPQHQSHFAHYRITHFGCENESCNECDKKVYLTHCMECLGVIDSRESAKCSNGWYICKACNSCCSDVVYNRRQTYLVEIGEKETADHYDGKGHKEQEMQYCAWCGSLKTKSVLKQTNAYGRIETVIAFQCKWCDSQPQKLQRGNW